MRLAAEAVDAARPFDVRAVLAMALCRSAEARVIAGDDDGAAADLVELLGLLRQLDTRRWLADALELAAVVLARPCPPGGRGHRPGAAEALRSAAGEPGGGVRAVADVVHRTSDAFGARSWGPTASSDREPPGGSCRPRR